VFSVPGTGVCVQSGTGLSVSAVNDAGPVPLNVRVFADRRITVESGTTDDFGDGKLFSDHGGDDERLATVNPAAVVEELLSGISLSIFGTGVDGWLMCTDESVPALVDGIQRE